MSDILITGAQGQVGRELADWAPQYPDLRCQWTDRSELDLTNADQIAQYFSEHQIDVVINCAAYTAVDKAESEAALAERVNSQGVEFLAKACQKHGAFLIQLSTDYVYHNGCDRPLLETDPLNPQSVYARTKQAGEEAALAESQPAMVVRTSWVYSAYGNNFVKTMLRLGQERDALRVVYDQVGTPTYARDLARVLLDIVQAGNYRQNPGIYNFSNEGVTSWYDFAHAIFAERQLDCQLTPIRSAEYPTAAARPPYSLLDKAHIKNTFQLTIPHWRDSLVHCLQRLP